MEENVSGRMALFNLNDYLMEHVDHKTRVEILRLVEEALIQYINYTSKAVSDVTLDMINKGK